MKIINDMIACTLVLVILAALAAVWSLCFLGGMYLNLRQLISMAQGLLWQVYCNA